MNIHIFIDYENIHLANKEFPSIESLDLQALEDLKTFEHITHSYVNLHVFNSLNQPIPKINYLRKFFLFSFSYVPILRIPPNTQNALDFRLIREIGSLKNIYKNSEFIILSKDKGYNSEIVDLNTRENIQENTYSRFENFVEVIQYLKNKYKTDIKKKDLQDIKKIQNSYKSLEKADSSVEITNHQKEQNTKEIIATSKKHTETTKEIQQNTSQDALSDYAFVKSLIQEVEDNEGKIIEESHAPILIKKSKKVIKPGSFQPLEISSKKSMKKIFVQNQIKKKQNKFQITN